MSCLAIQCEKHFVKPTECFSIMTEIKKFKFIRDGVEENVEPERWGWGCIYLDDTELHQFDANGIFHQFKEINLPEIKMFVMYKLDDMKKRIDMPITEDMQVFHFYRNIKPFYSDKFSKVYVFGFKKNGVASYHFILPDDRLIICDTDNIDLAQFNV